MEQYDGIPLNPPGRATAGQAAKRRSSSRANTVEAPVIESSAGRIEGRKHLILQTANSDA